MKAVVGKEALIEYERKRREFTDKFESKFMDQGPYVNRNLSFSSSTSLDDDEYGDDDDYEYGDVKKDLKARTQWTAAAIRT